MRMRQFFKTVFILFVAILMISSCSIPPSNQQCELAIRKSLEYYVPALLLEYFAHGRNANIELIEIMSINESIDPYTGEKLRNVWSVKARVKGTCQVPDAIIGANRKLVPMTFNAVGNFIVDKNEHGEWVAFYDIFR